MERNHLIEGIERLQNPGKARWLENYVKHDIKSFGVGIPELRLLIQEYEESNHLSNQQISCQISFLDGLMEHEYTEPKLAAILYIQLHWQTTRLSETLHLTSKWFDNGWVTDWNVCDWLCVRLLSPLVDLDAKRTVSELEKWNNNTGIWKSRASLVPFAQCKTIDKHADTILKFSNELIRREERFCKTAVGWVLREYSKKDAKFVIDFLEQNRNWTTKEVINNATKYLRIGKVK